MNLHRLIRKAIFDWTAWQRKRRLYKACPQLRSLDEAQRLAKRAHKPSKHYDAARAAVMVNMLKGE